MTDQSDDGARGESGPTCRTPDCADAPQGNGGQYSAYCSDACGVRFEHLRAAARDDRRAAKREAERNAEPEW